MSLLCTAQGPVVSLVARPPHGLLSNTKFCHSEWVAYIHTCSWSCPRHPGKFAMHRALQRDEWYAFPLVMSILSEMPNLKRMWAESLSSSIATLYQILSRNFQRVLANLIHGMKSNDSHSLICKSFSCCFFGSRPFSETCCHQKISCLMRQVGSLLSERQALIFSPFHQWFPQPSSHILPGWLLWLHQVMCLSLLITQYGSLIDPTYPVLFLSPSWLLCCGEDDQNKTYLLYCLERE